MDIKDFRNEVNRAFKMESFGDVEDIDEAAFVEYSEINPVTGYDGLTPVRSYVGAADSCVAEMERSGITEEKFSPVEYDFLLYLEREGLIDEFTTIDECVKDLFGESVTLAEALYQYVLYRYHFCIGLSLFQKYYQYISLEFIKAVSLPYRMLAEEELKLLFSCAKQSWFEPGVWTACALHPSLTKPLLALMKRGFSCSLLIPYARDMHIELEAIKLALSGKFNKEKFDRQVAGSGSLHDWVINEISGKNDLLNMMDGRDDRDSIASIVDRIDEGRAKLLPGIFAEYVHSPYFRDILLSIEHGFYNADFAKRYLKTDLAGRTFIAEHYFSQSISPELLAEYKGDYWQAKFRHDAAAFGLKAAVCDGEWLEELLTGYYTKRFSLQQYKLYCYYTAAGRTSFLDFARGKACDDIFDTLNAFTGYSTQVIAFQCSDGREFYSSPDMLAAIPELADLVCQSNGAGSCPGYQSSLVKWSVSDNKLDAIHYNLLHAVSQNGGSLNRQLERLLGDPVGYAKLDYIFDFIDKDSWCTGFLLSKYALTYLDCIAHYFQYRSNKSALLLRVMNRMFSGMFGAKYKFDKFYGSALNDSGVIHLNGFPNASELYIERYVMSIDNFNELFARYGNIRLSCKNKVLTINLF